jgi:hypothetical protein
MQPWVGAVGRARKVAAIRVLDRRRAHRRSCCANIDVFSQLSDRGSPRLAAISCGLQLSCGQRIGETPPFRRRDITRGAANLIRGQSGRVGRTSPVRRSEPPARHVRPCRPRSDRPKSGNRCSAVGRLPASGDWPARVPGRLHSTSEGRRRTSGGVSGVRLLADLRNHLFGKARCAAIRRNDPRSAAQGRRVRSRCGCAVGRGCRASRLARRGVLAEALLKKYGFGREQTSRVKLEGASTSGLPPAHTAAGCFGSGISPHPHTLLEAEPPET